MSTSMSYLLEQKLAFHQAEMERHQNEMERIRIALDVLAEVRETGVPTLDLRANVDRKTSSPITIRKIEGKFSPGTAKPNARGTKTTARNKAWGKATRARILDVLAGGQLASGDILNQLAIPNGERKRVMAMLYRMMAEGHLVNASGSPGIEAVYGLSEAVRQARGHDRDRGDVSDA